MRRFLPFFCLLVLWATGIVRAAEGSDRVNVLFIAVDDLNDWIGLLGGHPQALTPNIDRLGRRGITFSNAHCASPSCNPSRSAVFSGMMPWNTGVWSNEDKKLFSLHPDALVIPCAFRPRRLPHDGNRQADAFQRRGQSSHVRRAHECGTTLEPLLWRGSRLHRRRIAIQGYRQPQAPGQHARTSTSRAPAQRHAVGSKSE